MTVNLIRWLLRISRRAAVLFVASLTCVGCVALPWPHTITPYCHITGRAVDADTGRPIEGVRVYVKSDPGNVEVTGPDGRFHIKPQDKLVLGVIVPLGIPEPSLAPYVLHTLVLHDPRSEYLRSWGRGPLQECYRDQTVDVLSSPLGPVYPNRQWDNKTLVDDVGDVRLRKAQRPATAKETPNIGFDTDRVHAAAFSARQRRAG